MSSLLLWVGGLVAILASGYRLLRARHNLTPGVVYLCLAISCVGLSAALVAPGTLTVTLAFEPFPNATRLLGNGLAMAAAFCVHGLLSHLALDPARVRAAMRRQAVILAVALAAMTALLASAPIHSSTPNFVAVDAGDPHVLGYLLLFCAYIAIAAAQYIRLIHHYIRLSDRPWLRRGLTVVQLGAGIAIAWAIAKSTAAVIVYVTGRQLTIENPMSASLSTACVVLVAVGSTMPTWGPVAAQPARWMRQHQAYRVLQPLWDALHHAFPDITSTTGDPGPDQPRTIEWRLARRVVEIRDGLLLLAPYRDPSVGAAARTAAHRAGHPDPDATAEAAQLAAALRALQAGTLPSVSVPQPPQHQPEGLDAETAWLKRVARAYRQSPLVAGHDRVPVGEESSEHHR